MSSRGARPRKRTNVVVDLVSDDDGCDIPGPTQPAEKKQKATKDSHPVKARESAEPSQVTGEQSGGPVEDSAQPAEGTKLSREDIKKKRTALSQEDINWKYDGADSTAHGPVATPAQFYGALGSLDPGTTPWKELPVSIFVLLSTNMSLVNDTERAMALQHEANVLQRLRFQLEHPGVEMPAMPATDTFGEYVNTARDEIRRIQVRQAEIRSRAPGSSGATTSRRVTAKSSKNAGGDGELVVDDPPFSTHSSRITKNGFGV